MSSVDSCSKVTHSTHLDRCTMQPEKEELCHAGASFFRSVLLDTLSRFIKSGSKHRIYGLNALTHTISYSNDYADNRPSDYQYALMSQHVYKGEALHSNDPLPEFGDWKVNSTRKGRQGYFSPISILTIRPNALSWFIEEQRVFQRFWKACRVFSLIN